MHFENEITVEVDCNIDELKDILKKNKFVLKQEYDVNDIYLVKEDTNLDGNPLEILKKCVLIRNIITDEKNMKFITYKYKEFDNDGNIIKNGKANCEINNIDDANNLLNILGYKELLILKDHLSVYNNGKDEFVVQAVNDKHTYIEIEQDCEFSDKKYVDIDDMINSFNKYNIPIKNNDYFAKKAIVEFNELYR